MRANRFGEGRNATITENSYSEASGRLTIRSTERLGMGEGGRPPPSGLPPDLLLLGKARGRPRTLDYLATNGTVR